MKNSIVNPVRLFLSVLQSVFLPGLWLWCSAFFLFSCTEKYTPKPYGYFRIDFPEKKWVALPTDTLPYRFEMSSVARLENDTEKETESGWINLSYPAYNAKIHLSYKKINTDNALRDYLED